MTHKNEVEFNVFYKIQFTRQTYIKVQAYWIKYFLSKGMY